MGSDWINDSLGNVLEIKYGKDHKKLPDGEIPCYGTGGVMRKVDSSLYEQESILIPRKGSLNNIYFINEPFWTVDTLFWTKIDKSLIDPKFMFYQLKLTDFTSLNVGSAVPSLTVPVLNDLKIKYPSLSEQKAIAHILGSLDDKIELNRQMNETLESIAQALFKSWFVDFDPVIDNALAAGNPIPDVFAGRAEQRRELNANAEKSSSSPNNGDIIELSVSNNETASSLKSGGVCFDSAQQPSFNGSENSHQSLFPSEFEFTEVMGWVPKGWEVDTFSNLAILDTTSVKPNNFPEKQWEHYSIPAFDVDKSPVLDVGESIKSNKYKVDPKALLVSKLNPETERIWWVDIQSAENAICSTEFMQFIPLTDSDRPFVYSLIQSDYFQTEIKSRVTGSTGSRQRAQPKSVAVIDVLKPAEKLINLFSEQALNWKNKASLDIQQNSELAKLRDTLLPKLLSGELRIPDAEKLIEEANV